MWFRQALLCLLLFFTIWAEEISVSPSSCDDNEAIASSGIPITLNTVLQTLSSDSILYLKAGEHCIKSFSPLHGLNNISVIGEPGNTSVTCRDGIGLAFVNVSDLRFENIAIEQCGLNGDNLNESITLIREFVDIFYQISPEVNMGMVLGHVRNLQMRKVDIRNTDGIALLGVNVIGGSRLSEVVFTRNMRPAEFCSNASSLLSAQYTGGGIYILYQNYLPGKYPTESPSQYSLDIEDGIFVNNSDCSFGSIVEFNYFKSEALRELGYQIGGGGGLTVIFAQFDYGVDVTVSSSQFVDNTARYGGGVHIGIFTGVTDTHFAFQNCTFHSNGYVRDEVLADRDALFVAGGGALAVFNDLLVPETHPLVSTPKRNVSVELVDTSFDRNGGEIGGAVFIYSFFTSIVRYSVDAVTLRFIRCMFTRNSALFGPAMTVYEAKKSAMEQIGLQVELQDLIVTRNMAASLNLVASRRAQDNSAVIHMQYVNVTFTGNYTNITENEGTGFQSDGSLIGILGAKVVIDRNIGVYGGAMNLLQFSNLVITPGSKLLIRDNQARIQGGAIYTNLLGASSIVFFDDCFLHFDYQNFQFCQNCSNFNDIDVYIEISRNTAPSASIIYGSALRTCPWAFELRDAYPTESVLEILHTVFPTHFRFNPAPTGSQRVTTAPISLRTEDPGLQTKYYTVPGAAFNLSLLAIDTFGQNITSVITSYIVETTGNIQNNSDGSPNVRTIVGSEGFAILRNKSTETSVMLQSEENQTVFVGLYSVESLSASQVFIEVSVGFCPNGFIFKNDTLTCVCNPRLLEEDISCDVTNQLLLVPDGFWVGPIYSTGSLAVHECLEGYCQSGSASISVQDDPIDFDSQCEPGINRGGLLCGSCKEGYSLVIGSISCLKCNNGFSALFALFLVLGILLIVMISYFRITITGGYLNGVLFYSNIVSIYGRVLIPEAPNHGSLILASFLTLNFGIETCLYDGMSSLEKVWWQLSFPLYLVFLMIVIRTLARCCKWKRGAGFSVIQGVVTLSVLCYVSTLQSCVELLGAVNIRTLSGRYYRRWAVDPTVTYFEGWHGFLAASACILLVFYLIPLPLLLLFPSALYRIRFLRKLKPFYDAFWNPFEPNFRFWLGLRLIFRWIPFTLAFLQLPPENTFGTALILIVLQYFQLLFKPFKGFWRNMLDGFFLLNLIVLFLSSVFFRAVAESESDDKKHKTYSIATDLSIALVALAYVGFAVVVVYHIFARFPKLEAAVKKFFGRKKTAKTDSVDPQASTSINPVYFTQLREPLLESGSLHMVTTTSQSVVGLTGNSSWSITEFGSK